MTKTIKLPSGRKIDIKPIGAYELHRLNRAMPDLAQVGKETNEAIRGEKLYEQTLRTVLLCTVKPKFWADMRPEPEIDAKPLQPPAGYEQLDLDLADMMAAMEQISDISDLTTKKENVTPLSKTATG